MTKPTKKTYSERTLTILFRLGLVPFAIAALLGLTFVLAVLDSFFLITFYYFIVSPLMVLGLAIAFCGYERSPDDNWKHRFQRLFLFYLPFVAVSLLVLINT